jgi:DivIVA domain-containing protein
VALERQSIEKKDFPIGRRGYDPEAVDQHLHALADEIEELKRSSRQRSETLASAASDQVRSIVEAAEGSAAAIQRQAEEEAQEIRAEATGEAQTTRENATAQAREYVGKVSESTAVMLQRLDAMESELGSLIESLRTGANRLSADLQLLEGNLSEVSEAVAPRPRFEAEAEAVAEQKLTGQAPPVEDTDLFEEQAREASDGYGESVAEDHEETVTDREPVVVGSLSDQSAAGSDDTEGARLIALNMALNGTPREETDRYLAENFKLRDRDRLLDEVYASVAG